MVHDPAKTEKKLLPARVAPPDAKEELARREEERRQYELATAHWRDKVLAIVDLNSLREAEIAVAIALGEGTMDSKCAGAMVQILKHQMELLQATKPKEESLNEHGKQAVVTVALKMSDEEAWTLMQDFVGGYSRLKKKALETPDVDATTVEEISGQLEPSNDETISDGGLPAPGSVEEEVF